MPSGMSSVVAVTRTGPPRSSKSCEGIWGKGCPLTEQVQCAPFNPCGHDTSLELELGQVMNF